MSGKRDATGRVPVGVGDSARCAVSPRHAGGRAEGVSLGEAGDKLDTFFRGQLVRGDRLDGYAWPGMHKT